MFQSRKKILGELIPGSDSGKAEEAWALRICFSFDRGFAPASCAKITFRNQELFGYFFAEKKYQEEIKFETKKAD